MNLGLTKSLLQYLFLFALLSANLVSASGIEEAESDIKGNIQESCNFRDQAENSDKNKKKTTTQIKKEFKECRNSVRSNNPITPEDLDNLYKLKADLAYKYSTAEGVKESKKSQNYKNSKKYYTQIINSIEATEAFLFCKQIVNSYENSENINIESIIGSCQERIAHTNLENGSLRGLEFDINIILSHIRNLDLTQSQDPAEDFQICKEKLNEVNFSENELSKGNRNNLKLTTQHKLDSLIHQNPPLASQSKDKEKQSKNKLSTKNDHPKIFSQTKQGKRPVKKEKNKISITRNIDIKSLDLSDPDLFDTQILKMKR